jgi:hypothetical protein
MSARTVIEGHDGPIEIDEANRTVVKTFSRLHQTSAARKAKREVAYASCLFEVLSRVEGLACPRILSWELSPAPGVVMALCGGEPLSRFLIGVDGRDPRINEIANKIHDGLKIYTGLFAEPWHQRRLRRLRNLHAIETNEASTATHAIAARISVGHHHAVTRSR